MAGAEAELVGSTGFLNAIRSSKPFLEGLALADCRDKATRIAAHARALAPVGTPEEGDSHPGAMRDDISVRGQGIDSKGPFVDVGTTEPYGLFQEFGTVRNAAHPFMRPAIAAETGAEVGGRLNLSGSRSNKKV